MKKFVPILALLLLGAFSAKAASTFEKKVVPNYVRGYGNSFIFVENGITFSVYPDGEFDFYINNQVNIGVGARIGKVGVTFNSGYDYNPFVQYDDYGAIIQVENVPVFYDYYGRVSQIGGVDVWYRNGRVRRIGGLNVFWNGGVFSHYTGFINVYNRYYVYRPFHRWFARPAVGFCSVWDVPYRRYYSPIRYTWYRPYRNNFRRSYYDFGRRYSRYDNGYSYRNHSRRAKVYRNDRRVAVRENGSRRNYSGRSNRDYARNGNAVTERRTVSRSNRDGLRTNRNRVAEDRSRSVRSSTIKKGESVTKRSNRGNAVTQRTVTRTPRSKTVTKRQLTRTPERRTVTKRSTAYKKPQAKSSRSVVNNNRTVKRTSSVKRSATKRGSVSRSSSTQKRSTASRSSSSSRNRGNTNARSSRSRSSRVNR